MPSDSFLCRWPALAYVCIQDLKMGFKYNLHLIKCFGNCLPRWNVLPLPRMSISKSTNSFSLCNHFPLTKPLKYSPWSCRCFSVCFHFKSMSQVDYSHKHTCKYLQGWDRQAKWKIWWWQTGNGFHIICFTEWSKQTLVKWRQGNQRKNNYNTSLGPECAALNCNYG